MSGPFVARDARMPRWITVVGVLALLWSAMGCFAYVSQVTMSEADLARLPAGQAAMWRAMPSWATGAYAIGVWGSLFAAIALLARRRIAIPLFGLALIAVLVQFGWVFLGSGPLANDLPDTAWQFPLAIIVIQIAELAIAVHARPWLR